MIGEVIVRESLLVQTNIIGYKSQGESVVIFIKADGIIRFAGLIDCYRLQETDFVGDLLEENGLKSLDYICWTHPDLDHSKGMKEIIQKYADENTNIWIPEGVEEADITCSQEVQELFAYLKEASVTKEARFRVYSASDKKDMMYYGPLTFYHFFDEYPLRIVSYTPNSNMLRKQMYEDISINNDKSIFCIFQLGELRIALTGDVEDATLRKMPPELMDQSYHICKIPHHGSDSSIFFVNHCVLKCEIACSTVFRVGRSFLPMEKILDEYSKCTDHLFCTGKKCVEEEKDEYGMLIIETNVLNNTYSIVSKGNAERIS